MSFGVFQLKGVSKAAHVPANAPFKGSPAAGNPRKCKFSCGNCVEDHDKRACQHKDECLQCKTKSHAFWSPQCLHFITWRGNKQRKGEWLEEPIKAFPANKSFYYN